MLTSQSFSFSLDDNKPIWMHAEEREESKVRWPDHPALLTEPETRCSGHRNGVQTLNPIQFNDTTVSCVNRFNSGACDPFLTSFVQNLMLICLMMMDFFIFFFKHHVYIPVVFTNKRSVIISDWFHVDEHRLDSF